MSDDRLDRALALLREAGETIRRLVVRVGGAVHDAFTRVLDDAPSHVVHLLVNGIAACGAGLPYSWPEGDRWTDSGDVTVVTCPGCQAVSR
jgi:hypothetical protein